MSKADRMSPPVAMLKGYGVEVELRRVYRHASLECTEFTVKRGIKCLDRTVFSALLQFASSVELSMRADKSFELVLSN